MAAGRKLQAPHAMERDVGAEEKAKYNILGAGSSPRQSDLTSEINQGLGRK